MSNTTLELIQTRCVIVGGGPCGMMLGFLLARAGVPVVVLEKHVDFFRDFRGDTIHPSTLELFHELGLLDEFLKRPHQETKQLEGIIGDHAVTVADFSHLPTKCKFIAFMPQWDFLDFVAEQARKYPAFSLRLKSNVTDVIRQGDRVVGVRAMTDAGVLEVRADLVVGADGRSSTVRQSAGLEVIDLGAPMDVLWFRLPRESTDADHAIGRFDSGHILVLIDRLDYWQCGYVIPKGTFDTIKGAGLDAFRAKLVQLVPLFRGRTDAIKSWDDVRLLTVEVDRLRHWHKPGLLCIGDSAHAMSPVGGIGINLAVQDAVAASNILTPCFAHGAPTDEDLEAVQQRRELATQLTQGLQVLIQKRVITTVLRSREKFGKPWPLRLLGMFPFLSRIPARVIGLGFRPEHIKTAEKKPA